MRLHPIQKNARISLDELTEEVKKTMAEKGMLKNEETVRLGFLTECGKDYINVVVVRPISAPIV